MNGSVTWARVDPHRAREPEQPEVFSGTVWMQRIHEPAVPGGMEVVVVFFENGARTRPHVHSTEQILFFVEGEGVVATETERRLVGPGDIVVIPAGTWHWHGANKGTSAWQISVRTPGPTDWNAPLRDWSEW
jgi:quercetin dioxygenase-like cupin family protein